MNQECDSRPIDNDQPDLRKIAERMERGIRRFLNTPPQPRGDRPDDASATQPRRSRKRLQEPKSGRNSVIYRESNRVNLAP
jgi:hypothetical protein